MGKLQMIKEKDVKRIRVISGILLALMVGLVACGGDDGGSEAGSSSTSSSSASRVTLNENYGDALPVSSQLAIGTLLLEDTENAVTAEQAKELLTDWQMLQSLQNSGTAAQAELDVVVKQIQGDMTDAQLTAIKDMKLTADSMMEVFQERGGMGPGGLAGSDEEGGSHPPGGGGMMMPPGGGAGGGPGGGGMGGGGFGMGPGTGSGEQEGATTEGTGQFAGTAMTGMLVSLLEARAEGETWEIAAPNQDMMMLQNTLFVVVAEATGLDQEALRTQAGDGKTLLGIIEANGASADEVLAQVIAAETERVNQAVADGSLEQAEADEWLGNLEARVKETLEQPLQFGRGAPGGDAPEPQP
jgi:hypothetical protein